MAKIRESSGFYKILTILIIFSFILVAVFALGGFGAEKLAFGAGVANYDKIGETLLATSYNGGTGTINGTNGLPGSAADDFSFVGLSEFTGNNQVIFSLNKMEFKYTTSSNVALERFALESNKTIQSGSVLYKALTDSRYEVRATLNVETSTVSDVDSGSGDAYTAKLTWLDGTGVPQTTESTSQNGYACNVVSVPLAKRGESPLQLTVTLGQFTGSVGGASVYVCFNSIKITFSVKLKDAPTVGASLSTTISGENRTPVSFLSGDAGAASYFVKRGDRLKVVVNLTKDGAPFFIGGDYKNIMVGGKTSSMKWTASLVKNGVDGSIPLVMTEDVVSETQEEQRYEFLIPNIDNMYEGYKIVLQPALPIESSSDSTLPSLDALSVTVAVDNKRPEAPALVTTCALNKYFQSLKDNTTGNKIYHTEKAIGVSFQGLNTAGGSRENVYYTTKEAVFSNDVTTPTIASRNATVGLINFGIDDPRGSFALALVVFDEAGNASALATFPYVIDVDSNSYSVSASARLGRNGTLSEVNSGANSFGTFSFGNNQAAKATFKRGEEVVMRYAFRTTQLAWYKLANVFRTVNGNMVQAFSLNPEDGDGLTIEVTQEVTTYVFRFKMDKTETKDYITALSSRSFVFEFKRKLLPNIVQTTRTFEVKAGSGGSAGNAQGIDIDSFYYVNEKNEKIPVLITKVNEDDQVIDASYSVYYGKMGESGDVSFTSNLFSEAGNYRYKVELGGDSKNYYCVAEGDFIIKKADPGVKNFAVRGKNALGDKLAFIEYGTAGGIKNFMFYSADKQGGYSENETSIGLFGKFVVTSHSIGTPEYDNPSVGSVTLHLQFVPYPPSDLNGVMNSDNFATVSLSVTVEIVKRDLNAMGKMIFDFDPNVPIRYTGNAYNASLIMEELMGKYGILPGYIIYSYRMEGGDFGSIAPIQAGKYVMRAEIADSVSNYSGKCEMNLEIYKQTLTVGVTGGQATTFVYGYYISPTVTAKLGGTPIVISSWEYFYRRAGEGEEKYSKTVPTNAGHYQVKIAAQNVNYEGELVFDYTIRAVTVADVGKGLSVNQPTPQLNLDRVYLRFGMPLSAMSLSIGSVTYRKLDGTLLTVAGSFTPRAYNASTGALLGDASYVPTAEDIIKNRTYGFRFAFIPAEGTEFAQNFMELEGTSNVEIAPAIVKFDGVRLDDSEYGATLSAIIAKLQGFPTFSMYNSETKIYEDKEIKDGNFVYIGSGLQLSAVPPVGKYTLAFNFQAKQGQSNLYLASDRNIALQVTRSVQEVYVEYDGSPLTAVFPKYGLPAVIDKNNIHTRSGLTLDYGFRYFKNKDGAGTLSGEIADITWQGVGHYYMEIYIVDSNYGGSAVLQYDIQQFQLVKGQNTQRFPVAFGKYEWGNSTFTFQNANDMSGWLVRDDIIDVNKSHVPGAFRFITDTTYGAPQAETAVRIGFIPTDSANYTACEFDFIITVHKRTVAFEYSAETSFNAKPQRPEILLKDGGTTVAGVVTVAFTGGNDPIDAGIYTGKISVDDAVANYRGQSDLSYVILPQEVDVNIDIKEDGYFAGSAIVPSYTVVAKNGTLFGTTDGEVTFVYKDYMGKLLSSAPQNIGKYLVSISVGKNHIGAAQKTYSLKPIDVTVGNEVVQYQQPFAHKVGITPILANYTYRYGLRYRLAQTEDWRDTVPTDSGDYDVMVSLNENGYAQEYIFTSKLSITPLSVTSIVADGADSFVYAFTAPNLSFTANGLGTESEKRLEYQLYFSTEDGQTLAEAPFHVGKYKVTVRLNERNYLGETVFRYAITKGDSLNNVGIIKLKETEFKKDITKDESDQLFVGRGAFQYIFNKTTVTVSGKFSILTPNFTMFSVGDHDVTYEFVATSYQDGDAVFYPIGAGDIEAFRDVTTLRIIRKVLKKDDFNIVSSERNGDSVIENYDESPKGIAIVAVSSFFSPKEKIDIPNKAIITYRKEDGQVATSEKPYGVGTYLVTVNIRHDNFEGAFTLNMQIKKAKPVFDIPTYVKTARIGETLAAGTPVDGSVNPIGVRYQTNALPIAGAFAVKDSVTFNSANLQPFQVLFTPIDSENVETATVTVYAYVAANADATYTLDSNWFEVVEIANYGLYLTSSMIKIKDSAVGIERRDINGRSRVVLTLASGGEIYGDLVLARENMLFERGGSNSAPIYFQPDVEAFPTYQIGTTHVFVAVQNAATVRVENNIVYAVVSAGAKYSEATLYANLSISSPLSAGVSLTAPVKFNYSATGGFDFDKDATVPINGEFPSNVKCTYAGNKNFASENAEYSVTFIYLVKEANINVGTDHTEFRLNHMYAQSLDPKNTLSYLGNTLELTFSGTGDGTPKFTLSVECTGNLQLLDHEIYGRLMYEPGKYWVTITIDKTSGYYGQRRILYEVTKRDISEFIVVNEQKNDTPIVKTYLEPYSILPAAYSPTLEPQTPYDVDFSVKYRNILSGDYTVNLPLYAGNYIILVEVEFSDRYIGKSEFKLNIEKKILNVAQQNLTYTFGTEVMKLSPKIDGNITQWDFSFTCDGNTIYNRYPENAGVYIGKIILTDSNHRGEGTFTYTVFAARVAVVWPQFSQIIYGQSLSQAEIRVPGSASVNLYGKFENAEGVFEFESPASILNAGEREASMRFTPNNANLSVETSKILLMIEKASVTISIGQTEFVYNGVALDLKKVYTVYPDSDIIPEYIIRRDNSSGEIINEIRGAGIYYVIFTVDNDNYFATTATQVVVRKGTADLEQTAPPKATAIEYGQILNKSSLSGGTVLYGGKPVYGTFRFLQPENLIKEVGSVEVAVVFVPSDSANYAEYNGYTVWITVNRATVSIEIDAATTVNIYGAEVKMPKFSVSNISADFEFEIVGDFASWIGNIVPAGTIEAKVKIKNNFYAGEKTFTYTVIKKQIGIEFYSSAIRDSKVETYSSIYGETFVPYPGIVAGDLIEQDAGLVQTLNSSIYTEYILADGTRSKTAPENVGDNYYVSARIDGGNYNGTAKIRYSVLRGNVSDISIGSATLNFQIYGSVVAPNVVITPAGVGYIIDYGNGAGLPSAAGSYNIKITINDPNYTRVEKSFVFIVNKKKLTVADIYVADKKYDGVSNLSITGTLVGLLLGDEVTLAMTARTAGDKSAAGEYGVEITSVKLGGRHASNYTYVMPEYGKLVKIIENRVSDPGSGSYVVFVNGTLPENITVEFKNAVSAQNKENVFSTLLGQKAQVISFSVKKDGIKTDLQELVKVYIKIPERFRNAKNLNISGLGALSGEKFAPTREGDYITFYTSKSGEIVLEVSDFPYGIIFVSAGIAFLIFGIFAICLFEPIKKRKARKYKMRDNNK